jgi:hypothetical protein
MEFVIRLLTLHYTWVFKFVGAALWPHRHDIGLVYSF